MSLPWEFVVIALAALAGLAQRAWHVRKSNQRRQWLDAADAPPAAHEQAWEAGPHRVPQQAAREQAWETGPYRAPQQAAREQAWETGPQRKPRPAAREQAWESGLQRAPRRQAPRSEPTASGKTGEEDAGLLGTGPSEAQRPAVRTSRPRSRLLARLRGREYLRDAVLAKEVLERPAWLRDDEEAR